MNIQIPPNLSPENYDQSFLSSRELTIGEGISPITSDYVNPEFSWPEYQQMLKRNVNDLQAFHFKC